MRAFIVALAVVISASTAAFGETGELHSLHPVGFQIVAVPDPQEPDLQVGIWYPTTAAPQQQRLGLIVQDVARNGPVTGERLPLVVISHGNQGAMTSHADTAMALADAGFVVAAPVHTGDNFADQSAVGGPKWFIDRSRHIAATIDYMLKNWVGHAQIDASRIGIFGFSAGGTTALISIGGELDFMRLQERCATAPELACTLWKPAPSAAPLVHDARIKAAVIAAPGYGFAFAPNGLKNVSVPVQLWNGDADKNVPAMTNAIPLRDALGNKAEFHLVPGAEHFSFLTPCGPDGPQVICGDPPGFDRKAFHKTLNAEVVAFFKTKM